MVHFFFAILFEFVTFQVLGMLIQISGKLFPGAMAVKILLPRLLYHMLCSCFPLKASILMIHLSIWSARPPPPPQCSYNVHHTSYFFLTSFKLFNWVLTVTKTHKCCNSNVHNSTVPIPQKGFSLDACIRVTFTSCLSFFDFPLSLKVARTYLYACWRQNSLALYLQVWSQEIVTVELTAQIAGQI